MYPVSNAFLEAVKNDKNISGLLAQIEAGKIGIHTFTNASSFMVADVDTKIISIEFATTEANHAQFFGQVIVDVTAQPGTRSVTASGDVVIPSVNVDGVPVDPDDPEEEPVVIGNTEEQTITVSLPMSWHGNGQSLEIPTRLGFESLISEISPKRYIAGERDKWTYFCAIFR